MITLASSSAASLTLAFQKSATSTIPSAVNAFSFATSVTGTPILSIDGANGRVGIGTAGPDKKLSIAQSADSSGLKIYGYDDRSTEFVSLDVDSVGNTLLTTGNGRQLLLQNGTAPTDNAAIAMYSGTAAQTSGTNQIVKIVPVYNQSSGTAANTDLLINRTETAVGSGAQYLFDAQVGGVSKFNVTNTGRVGIGTTSPFARLSIAATSTATLDNQNLFAISTSTASATSTAFIIDANGKVGIGTSSPSQQLSIQGNTYLTGGLGVGRPTTPQHPL